MLSHGLPQMSFVEHYQTTFRPSVVINYNNLDSKLFRVPILKHRDLDIVQQKPQGGCKHSLGGGFDLLCLLHVITSK
jgi:hypothetical protein